MKNYLIKNTLIGMIFIASTLILSSLTQAQEMSSSSPSTGRTNGITMDMSKNNYIALVKIRKQINEGDFKKARRGSLRLIKSEDRTRRSGIGKTVIYRDAYNCLCVSLTGLGDVENAMEACDTSIDLNAKQWESLKSRATLYYMKQDFPNSLNDFNLALEHAPDNQALTDILKQNIAVVASKVN